MSVRSRVILLFFCIGAAGLGVRLTLAGWTQPAASPVQSVSSLAQPVSNPAQSAAGSAQLVSDPAQSAASPAQPVPGLAQPIANPAGCRFSGQARLRLAPAPPGTEVEGWVDGTKVAKGLTTQAGEATVYGLTVDGAYAGKMVIFRFSGYPGMLLGQAVCEAGAEQVVNLDEMVIGGCGGH